MSKNKVQAVYELREAAEEHGRAEERLETDRTGENIDRLLDAKELLEVKTVEAIQSCEHCGEAHCDDPSHTAKSNVVNIKFARSDDETG